jgi:hypothetical protein
VTKETALALTESELALVRKIAARDGMTEDQAATQLMQSGLARRVRKKTGNRPARVYSMRGKK